MTTRTPAPLGHWPSPISPEIVAAGLRRFGLVQAGAGWVYWIEGRPEERGRQAIMRGRPGGAIEEVLAAPHSARSRVHEYGGGDFAVIEGVVWFVSDPDQTLCRLAHGGSPEPVVRGDDLRLADFAPDPMRRRLVAVAERAGADPHRPENLLVAIGTGGTGLGIVAELVRGRDFYAFPRPSPDGRQLAFLAWDLPGMPWDEAGLYVAPVDDDGGLGNPTLVAGSNGAAAMEPVWLDARRLAFATDRGGHGRIGVWDGTGVTEINGTPGEIGRPMWALAHRSFVVAEDGDLIASCLVDGAVRLVRVSPDRGAVETLPLAATAFESLSPCGDAVAGLVGLADAATAVAVVTPGQPAPAILRRASDMHLPRDQISPGRQITFTGGDGAPSHAFHYPPASATHCGSDGTRPPAIVLAHGGPTAASDASLKLRLQFFTSRGFAVCDVNYAGSTGYGRAYRERLDGRWGIADVADCAAAARHLGAAGLADPNRIAIAGGSAGGYTVLMALATTDVFAAGSCHYGISDLALLLAHTHKFEAGYLHRLMGTTPDDWQAIFAARSPITIADRIRAPLILFQGLDDRVVPPEQSRLIAERLRVQGRKVALHEYAGEGHGFRRADTIAAVLTAELAFLQATIAAPAA